MIYLKSGMIDNWCIRQLMASIGKYLSETISYNSYCTGISILLLEGLHF